MAHLDRDLSLVPLNPSVSACWTRSEGSVAGQTLWNTLPSAVREASTVAVFNAVLDTCSCGHYNITDDRHQQ